jgi:hypothetical protein
MGNNPLCHMDRCVGKVARRGINETALQVFLRELLGNRRIGKG